MKTTNDYLVSELDRSELRSINGGGFWGDFGRTIGRAWCSIKHAFSEFKAGFQEGHCQ